MQFWLAITVSYFQNPSTTLNRTMHTCSHTIGCYLASYFSMVTNSLWVRPSLPDILYLNLWRWLEQNFLQVRRHSWKPTDNVRALEVIYIILNKWNGETDLAEPVDPVRLCPRLNDPDLPASELTISCTSSTSDTYVQPLCMPTYHQQTAAGDAQKTSTFH